MDAMKRRRYVSCVTTGALGLALIGLAACNSGESTPTAAPPAPGGSAGFSGPLAFVNNTGDKTLSTVALKGDSVNTVVNTIDAAKFENVALSDMQFSSGEWVFVNLTAANKVATIDPLTAATPVHEVNLPAGTRPVHIYRDANDGEVIWVMNDGDNAPGTTTPGDDVVNCAARGGGSVTVMHNSHLGPGATPPTVLRTICILADGHHVTAFSGDGVPKRAFVSSEVGGEIAVIDDEESSADYLKMIHRIDLCNASKETTLPTPAACNPENPTGTVAFTPNNAGPHGIRWSKLTKKIYSIQEGYGEIAEIDPTTLAITNTFDLTGTPYTGYGISPDGRYLLLRGETTAPQPQAIKLGIIDLSAATPTIANLNIPELDGASNGSFLTGGASFKFSPDGKRLYFLLGNSTEATVTKKDRLFAFDASTLSAAPPALTLLPNGEIPLLQTGRHSMDVLAQGAGEAKYVVVSNNGAPGSVSIINAADNAIKENVTIGISPGALLVYQPGAATAGNQASN
ncbi:MAG: hypothetical protein JSS39_04020 [Nitrospira sp.]|nr:hypothetical protein [Nitrospira sp.]